MKKSRYIIMCSIMVVSVYTSINTEIVSAQESAQNTTAQTTTTNLKTNIKNGFKSLWQGVKQAGQQQLLTAVNNFTTKLGSNPTGTTGIITGGGQVFQTQLINAYNDAKGHFNQVYVDAYGNVTERIQALDGAGTVNTVQCVLQNQFSDVQGRINRVYTDAHGNVITVINELNGAISTTVQDINGQIISGNAATQINSNISTSNNMLNNISTKISSTANTIKTRINSIRRR